MHDFWSSIIEALINLIKMTNELNLGSKTILTTKFFFKFSKEVDKHSQITKIESKLVKNFKTV